MVRSFLVIVALGCSSGESTSATTDAATDTATTVDAAGQEKMICDALASRSACPGGALECSAEAKCIYGRVMLPAAASAWVACRSAPSCKKDDECVAAAGTAVGGAAADKYGTDCLARLTACPDAFKDDLCSTGVFAYANAGTGAAACITKPCDQIAACFATLQALKDIAACK